MGNQRNTRRRVPTARKSAADNLDLDAPPRPLHINFHTQPKPRPTGKAAKDRRSVTWADNNVSMVNHDAGEDEVMDEDMDESGTWDEDDEDVEEPGM